MKNLQCLRRGRVDLTELPPREIGRNDPLCWIEINDRHRLRINDVHHAAQEHVLAAELIVRNVIFPVTSRQRRHWNGSLLQILLVEGLQVLQLTLQTGLQACHLHVPETPLPMELKILYSKGQHVHGEGRHRTMAIPRRRKSGMSVDLLDHAVSYRILSLVLVFQEELDHARFKGRATTKRLLPKTMLRVEKTGGAGRHE
mmetsp:Transcript_12904/g.18008  ORF Transcript_12904/g.18008 Transcript_12904/m.18008 type:complete len:200 (-) Transcript_12904:316-915(-)